eukprot:2471013-Rhodomonas_salina.1
MFNDAGKHTLSRIASKSFISPSPVRSGREQACVRYCTIATHTHEVGRRTCCVVKWVVPIRKVRLIGVILGGSALCAQRVHHAQTYCQRQPSTTASHLSTAAPTADQRKRKRTILRRIFNADLTRGRGCYGISGSG